MKGRTFDTIEEIQEESQWVADTMPSRDASKHGRNAGTAVFAQNGSTLKVMEEFNIQGKRILFTSIVLELLDTPLYSTTVSPALDILL